MVTINFLFEKHKFPTLAFLIPLAVRVIPEILMGPYLVGFDQMAHYIPCTLTLIKNGVSFWHLLASAPLFWVFLIWTTSLGVPLTITLKLAPPLLQGFLGLSVYFYAKDGLVWSRRKSFFTALLATLYFVALRISFDLLRNELGLALLFISLALIQREGSRWRNCVLLSLAMVLTVLTHQLVAVIMLAIATVTLVHMVLNKKYSRAQNLIVASVPAALSFLLILYANRVVSPSFTLLSSFLMNKSGWTLLLFASSSYQDMALNVLGFLFYCYLPLLPLVIIGAKHFKNIQTKTWILLSLSVILSPIFYPNAFSPWGYRWTLMLTYPLTFYTMEAITHFNSSLHRLIPALIVAGLTLSFTVIPPEHSLPYYNLFPYYVPSSMLQNTVPLSDCQDVVNALEWFKEAHANSDEDAYLLAHMAFYGWSLLHLNGDKIIPYNYGNPEKVAQEVSQGGHSQLYLIWWTEGNGWHGQTTVPLTFKEIYRSNKIAIYAYTP